jgi:hypothetical protein
MASLDRYGKSCPHWSLDMPLSSLWQAAIWTAVLISSNVLQDYSAFILLGLLDPDSITLQNVAYQSTRCNMAQVYWLKG